MGTAAKPTRENRTITVDFQNETTYFQLLGGGRPSRPEGRGFHTPGWLRCGPCGATPFPPRPERRGFSGVLGERVKAGMARAKAQGKRISRAPIAKGIQVRIAELHAQGTSLHQISKQLGIGDGTVWNYVQHAKQALSP